MADPGHISRRDFLKLSSGAVTLGVLPQSRAATVTIGLIGAGRQGLCLLRELIPLQKQQQIRLAGLCDVWQPALTSAATLLHDEGLTLPRLTRDYRELLSWPDIQAVMIATPDFSHTPLALAALEAGKDVYLETPPARTTEEIETLQRTAHNTGRMVYAGDAVNSQPGYAVAAELVRSGLPGKISRIHIVMNIPAADRVVPDIAAPEIAWEQFLLYLPPRPFEAARFARWQDFQESSDGPAIALLAQAAGVVHRVMQVAHPLRVAAQGGVYVWQDGRDNPDTFYAILDYAEGFVVSFSAHPGRTVENVFAFYGTHGTLDLVNWRLTPDTAIETPVAGALAHHASRQLALAAQSSSDVLRGDLMHWLAVLRQRLTPSLEAAHQQVAVAQMALEAYRSGRHILSGR